MTVRRRRKLIIWTEGDGPFAYTGRDGKTYLLTDEDIVALQAEAEAGYDVSHLKPRTEKCPLCGEAIEDPDVGPINGTERAHRPCLLRAVVGGIGHLEDHAMWCVERGDPDGGRTYRQSAIEVDLWVSGGRPLWKPGAS